MLVKYREELTRPIQEAMEFMRRIETQLNMLSNGPVRIFGSGTNRSFSFGSFNFLGKRELIGFCEESVRVLD